MDCRTVWVVHIKQCRQARVQLLRNLSAKKINKPFDHKGPIHSLTLWLTLSFCLSLIPPPPSPSPQRSLSQSALLDPDHLTYLKTYASERKEQQTWLEEPGDGQMDGQAGRPTYKDFFISWGREHNMENFLITPQYLISDFSTESPPVLKSTVTHMLEALFSTNKHVCKCVLTHASVARMKRPSSPITLLLWPCAAFSGCGSITICPLRPIFHFQHRRFPL